MLKERGLDMLAVLHRYGASFAVVAREGSDKLFTVRLPNPVNTVPLAEVLSAALNAS
jgi:hypothetical protein